MCAVNELAGSDDIHFSGRESNKRVGFKVHKVEGDLGNLADGAIAHEVRVRGRVKHVGFVVHCTCR